VKESNIIHKVNFLIYNHCLKLVVYNLFDALSELSSTHVLINNQDGSTLSSMTTNQFLFSLDIDNRNIFEFCQFVGVSTPGGPWTDE
jgi:hypothetical protein